MPINTAIPPSVNGLIRARLASTPDLPILGVPDRDLVFQQYSFAQIDAAATLLARYYASAEGGALPIRQKGDAKTEMRIAILAPSGFDYVVRGHSLRALWSL